MGERRKQIRVSDSLKIKYKVISPPDGFGGALSINISEGGISFPIDKTLIPGVVLDLEIILKDSPRPIEATGEVVWIRQRDDENFPFTVGIKFLKVNPRDRDRVYYHIHKRDERLKSGDVEWLR